MAGRGVHNLVADDRAQAIAVEVEYATSRQPLDIFGHRQTVLFDDQGQKCVGDSFGGVGHGGHLVGGASSYIWPKIATASPPICTHSHKVPNGSDPQRFSPTDIISFPLPAGSPKDQAGERSPADDLSPSSAGRVPFFISRIPNVRYRASNIL